MNNVFPLQLCLFRVRASFEDFSTYDTKSMTLFQWGNNNERKRASTVEASRGAVAKNCMNTGHNCGAVMLCTKYCISPSQCQTFATAGGGRGAQCATDNASLHHCWRRPVHSTAHSSPFMPCDTWLESSLSSSGSSESCGLWVKAAVAATAPAAQKAWGCQ